MDTYYKIFIIKIREPICFISFRFFIRTYTDRYQTNTHCSFFTVSISFWASSIRQKQNFLTIYSSLITLNNFLLCIIRLSTLQPRPCTCQEEPSMSPLYSEVPTVVPRELLLNILSVLLLGMLIALVLRYSCSK